MSFSRLACAIAAACFVPFACSFAGGPPKGFTLGSSDDSPQGDISIEYYSDGNGNNQIWLAPKDKPEGRVLLYEFQRSASVLMAPNEKILAINDDPTSSGEPLLYKRGSGLKFEEIPGLGIGDKAFKFMAQETKLSPDLANGVDHMLVTAVMWSSTSRAVLVSLGGHGGHVRFDTWLCVYDVPTAKVTLSLAPMDVKALTHE